MPDLPGYGYSTTSTVSSSEAGAKSEHDRGTVGYGILSAVRAVYAGGGSASHEQGRARGRAHRPRPRGSRDSAPHHALVCLLLIALDPPQSPNIRVLGAMMLRHSALQRAAERARQPAVLDAVLALVILGFGVQRADDQGVRQRPFLP